MTIEELRPDDEAAIEGVSEVLHACVHGGASVSFILPFSMDDARSFWRNKVLPGVAAGTRRVLLARDEEGRVLGTVQLDLATPPNQKHRADVLKLLVRPDARRQGIARKLMTAVESVAARHTRTLLTLDTVAGSDAEQLYRSLGYTLLGVMPGYSKRPDSGHMEACSFFYKELAGL